MLKWSDCAAGPQPQVIDGGSAVAGNQLIESDGVDVLCIHPTVRLADGGILVGLAATAESHRVAHTAARRFPHIAQTQPAAGDFALAAVGVNDLRENAVVVADAVTHRRVVQSRQRIQEARRQAAQTAIPQSRVDLLSRDVLELVTHGAQHAARLVHQIAFQAGQGVEQRAAGQIFDREIAHPFHMRVRHTPLGGQPAQREFLAHRKRQRIVDIARRRRVGILAEGSGETVQQRRLQRAGLQGDVSAIDELGVN